MTKLRPLARRVAETQDVLLAHREELPLVRTKVLLSFDTNPGKRLAPRSLGVGHRALLLGFVVVTWVGSAFLLGRGQNEAALATHDTEVVARTSKNVVASSSFEEAASTHVPPVEPSPPSSPSTPTHVGLPRAIDRQDLPPRPVRVEVVQPSRAEATTLSQRPSWQTLASKGRYQEAYLVAEQIGVAALCDSSNAIDLLTLAEAARFSAHSSDARRSLLAVRARFAGSAEEEAATFSLGRLAFEDFHDPAEAVRWFSTTLREHPNGSLTREVSGRLIEALERLGDSTGARSQAERYLQAFPSGPHAGMARRILGR